MKAGDVRNMTRDELTDELAKLFRADPLYEGGADAARRNPTFLGNHDAGRFPALLSSPAVRRGIMHPVIERTELASRPTTYRFVRDLARCQALEVAVGDPETRRMRTIEEIDVPTRIVWSGSDRVLSGHWAQTGYDSLPATVQTLPGVGHLPMLDDPVAVATLIRAQVAEESSPTW